MNTGSVAVDAITKLNLTGNIIPHTWYQEIRVERTLPGKAEKRSYPDLNAILILAEIIFFYRAIDEVDEGLGRKVVWRKRFAADKMQRSVASFSDRLGLSDKQVREALHRLQKAGLITLELRTIKHGAKVVANNAMFVEPVPARVEEISFPKQGTPLSPGGDTPLEGETPLSLEGERGGALEVTTLPTPGDRPSPPRGIDEYTEHTQSTTQTGTGGENAPPQSYGAVPDIQEPEPEEAVTVQARSILTPPPNPLPAPPVEIVNGWKAEDLEKLRGIVVAEYPSAGPKGGYRPSKGDLDLLAASVPRKRARDFVAAVRHFAKKREGEDSKYTKGLRGFLTDGYWEQFVAAPPKGKRRVISSTTYDRAPVSDILESLGIRTG